MDKILQYKHREDKKARMGTKLVVKKLCKSDFSNMGDFRKIVKEYLKKWR